MERENVWDYPRPPRVEWGLSSIRIAFGGRTIAETSEAWRVLETSHPSDYYLPRNACTCEILPSIRQSFCEWKGMAAYWSRWVGGHIARDCAWSYPDSTPEFEAIRDHLRLSGCDGGLFRRR